MRIPQSGPWPESLIQGFIRTDNLLGPWRFVRFGVEGRPASSALEACDDGILFHPLVVLAAGDETDSLLNWAHRGRT